MRKGDNYFNDERARKVSTVSNEIPTDDAFVLFNER